jgi:hypothetical protein
MADPLYAVGIEFSSGSYTNITEDVIRMSVSRSLANPFEKFRPGTANFILDNMEGVYSPDNATSPYAGLMRPQLQVRIHASHSSNSYSMFQGYIDEWSPNPDLSNPRICNIMCRDQGKRLMNRNITTSMFINYNVGSVFVEVMSLANVNSFSIDIIADEQPYAWFRDRKLTGVIDELLTEGFFFAYADGAGTFNVKKRYFDLEQVVVASFQEFKQLEYVLNDDFVMNDVTVEGVPRKLDPDIRSIANIDNSILIQASASVTFFLEYLDPDNSEPSPAQGLVAPINSTDYQMFVNSDGTGTELTATCSASVTFFGQTAKNVVFNGSSTDAWLTRYGIRGQPLHRGSRISSNIENDSSQSVYGRQSFRLSNEMLAKESHNNNYAKFLIDRYHNPKPDVRVTVENVFPNILNIDLAEKVVLIDSITGISGQYIVQGISHEISMEQGLVHTLAIEVYKFGDSEVLILDDATYGKLDERKLGF